MLRLFSIFFIFISACSSPANIQKKEVTIYQPPYSQSYNAEAMEGIKYYLKFIHGELSHTETEKSKKALNSLNIKVDNLQEILTKIQHGSSNPPHSFNDTLIPTQNLSEKLGEIRNQLTNISNTLYNHYNKNGLAEAIKSMGPIVAAFFVFIWGLLNLRSSEARARMVYITPLIDKSNRAIEDAYNGLASNIKPNNAEITKIIEPIIQIIPFLNEDSFVELVLQANEETFKLVEMCLPSSIKTEIQTSSLLNIFLQSNSPALANQQIVSTLHNQYNNALNDFLDYSRKKSPRHIFIKRIILLIVSITLISIYYCASII